MKTCIDCSSTETLLLSLRKDKIILSIERVCTEHLLRRIEWMNCRYPDLSYEAKIRGISE